MKTQIMDGEKVTVYGEDDFGPGSTLQAIIDMVAGMWERRAKEYVAKHGDKGSCVLGAGFWVWYMPKGKRKPVKRMVISAESISPAQGSLTWEASKDEMAKLFAEYKIAAEYAWGRMD